MKLMEE